MSIRKTVTIGALCGGAAAVAIWMAAAVSRPPAPLVPPGDLTGEAGDICEAVLRYQFDNNASSAQRRNAKAFFITIGTTTWGLPRPQGRRFCLDASWSAQHPAGSSSGGLFAFDSSAGFGRGTTADPSASGCTYHLRRTSGRWVVIPEPLDCVNAQQAAAADERRAHGER
jgi:hypothetical protein